MENLFLLTRVISFVSSDCLSIIGSHKLCYCVENPQLNSCMVRARNISGQGIKRVKEVRPFNYIPEKILLLRFWFEFNAANGIDTIYK